MPVKITPELINPYIEGLKKHKAYDEANKLYQDLKTHADGVMPKDLIEQRRPSESTDTKAYREKIYVAKTKNPIGKVLKSLSKIRRSPDWNIDHPQNIPARIIPGERLQDYCEVNYPEHTSVTNWAFSHLLKNMGVDANAVVMVAPLRTDIAETEYYKPVAMIFNSDQVLYYEDGAEFAILKSHERSDYIKEDQTPVYAAGQVFYVVSTTEFMKYEQATEGGYKLSQYKLHNFGKLPVFRIKSPFLKQLDNTTIQESHLSAMLPSLTEAAREYSDLQAAIVQHMHPLFWYYTNKNCPTCAGTGKIIDQSGPSPCQKECTICQGSGKIKFSPYAHLEVDPPKLGETGTPTPPAGYIGRDVEIMKLQDERVKNHLYEALASINMQFLDQTPLNISGEAKNVDREELNNFVYNFAEDLVATMDKVYYWINEWRYSVIIADYEKRQEMLPKIAVPQNFDLLPADYLMDEISKAKTAKVNPILVSQMEQDYADKKFYNNPELSSTIECYYNLDPLLGYGADEKMSMLMNGGITKEDYITSNYIVSFVKRAIFETADFLSLKLDAQKKIIEKYAKEKAAINNAAEAVKTTLEQDRQNSLKAV